MKASHDFRIYVVRALVVLLGIMGNCRSRRLD
jgi:hypothetical protein